MDETLLAGFSRVIMNPDEPVPLGGYGNEEHRFHESIGQDICVTAVALTDHEGSTVMIMGVDLVNADTPLCQRIRDAVCGQTGLPQDRLYITAAHSHAAPSVRRMDMPAIVRYNEKVVLWCCQAAAQALSDRKPATISTGTIQTNNLNFVKHYRVRDSITGDVSVIGDLFGTTEGKTILDHVSMADKGLHLVRLSRDGGKDIVLANFRAHPHFDAGSKKYILSSDYIGAFRKALEAMTGCHALYLQGACGNINATTRMSAERRYTNSTSYGIALAAAAVEGLEKHMTPCAQGPIRAIQFQLQTQVNRGSTEQLEAAQQVYRVWKETYDYAQCKVLSEPYGIRSPYHAGAIIANTDRPDSDGLLVLNAVCIGPQLAFTTFPGEMFDSLGLRIAENSPFKTTLMLGYCNHNMSYLPSMAAYRYSCYETDISRFAPGTGEQVADACIEALRQL